MDQELQSLVNQDAWQLSQPFAPRDDDMAAT